MSDNIEPIMTTSPTVRARRRNDSGQTLVIAIIILGVLMILGFAFSAIISRNVNEADRGRRHNLATELARSGAEYAHYQLRYSGLGADWRPVPTPPDADVNGFTKDPDALYLRPADPTMPFSNDPRLANVADKGGPDGYGPYTRVFWEKGRSLLRVSFTPFNYEAFANPNGQLRDPGRVRSYITIEVVGRPSALRSGTRIDPSLQLPERVKVFNYASLAEKSSEIGRLKALDNTVTNTRKLLAFSSIGIIEHLRFITDNGKVSRTAEIGWPSGRTGNGQSPFDQATPGAEWTDGQAPYSGPTDSRPVDVQTIWGQAFAEPNQGRANNWQNIPGLGSLYSNVGVTLYGWHKIAVNASMGESWDIANAVKPANSETRLDFTRTYYDRINDLWKSDVTVDGTYNNSTVTTPITLRGPALDSNQSSFTTIASAFRDGYGTPDSDGHTRGIPRKEAGSIRTVDPQNRQDRYLTQTRESGQVVNGRNTGRWGLGRGTYVDSAERGNTDSEDQRAIAGAVKALTSDWLNPNNAASQGWKGPYYIPIASYMKLLPDGFEVTRDSRSRSPFWRAADGSNTNKAKARFRIRTVEYPTGSGKFVPMILNSIMNAGLVGRPGNSLTDDDFRQFGQVFNGVVYFEGDVRVRGVIPTDQQLSVISMGTIYVEGSVVKGVVNEFGTVLNRPSRSAIMLAARDNVCVNTTMFFGPTAGQRVDEKNENAVPDTPNPFELKLEDPEIIMEAQFLLDPNTPSALGGNPNNPTTWQPYANHYVTTGGNANIPASMLISSSADDNGPAFVSVDIAPGSYSLIGNWGFYLFPRNVFFGGNPHKFNAADEFFIGVNNIPVYGIGNPLLNSYPKFETIEFPLVNNTFNYTNRQLVPANGSIGNFVLGVQDPTLVRVRMNGIGNIPMKNYLAARTAITPSDIRIEAAMYAEDGCFFVIPGNWFNTTTQDSRRNWMDRTAGTVYGGLTDDQANERRFELFGHTPSVPFYAEPLDVKISIFGAISENMPAPISAQAEWLKKWGWIPRLIGSTGLRIPTSHTSGFDPNVVPTLPNLIMTYDPSFASASVWDASTNTTIPIRTDENGSVLPPMPRLPVSPTLAYFGEVNP